MLVERNSWISASGKINLENFQGGKMDKSFRGRAVARFWKMAAVSIPAVVLFLAGCAPTVKETQKKGVSGLTEKEYVIPKKPVDRHAIGWAWSKQFGPVEDPNADEIQIKKEKSFSSVQQGFAYNIGLGLGGQTVEGPGGQAQIQRGRMDRSRMEGVEIISPVS